MIFVTIGTGKFDKLVKKADELSKEIKEKIIIQIGKSKYLPKNADFFEFTENFENYVKKARVVISHGGAGTIFDLLRKQKKIIALANLNRIDNHQGEILGELEKEDCLIYCRNFKLKESLEKIKSFKFKKYEKPECWIDKEIINFLD